jgi:hypothetical protein
MGATSGGVIVMMNDKLRKYEKDFILVDTWRYDAGRHDAGESDGYQEAEADS